MHVLECYNRTLHVIDWHTRANADQVKRDSRLPQLVWKKLPVSVGAQLTSSLPVSLFWPRFFDFRY